MEHQHYEKFGEYVFPQIKRKANEQGLHAYIFPYHPNDDSVKNSGYYLVTSPSFAHEELLNHMNDYMGHLIEKQKMNPPTFFDCNYRVFDINEYKEGRNDFELLMNIMRDVDTQAVAVDAFREIGYAELPTLVNEFSVFEMQRMKRESENPELPQVIRDRYQESYKNFVKYVYDKSVENALSQNLPLKEAKKQRVRKPDFFVKNKVPTDCIQISNHFRPYFEQEIKKHPQFYYYIDNKPTLELLDISNLYEGKNSKLAEMWSNDKGKKEYEITFPLCYQEIVYGIINQYNNRNLPGCVHNKAELGNSKDLVQITVSQWDMDNWASLCEANNVPYYVNKGDVAPINRDNYYDKNIVLINQKHIPMANTIMQRLVGELNEVRQVPLKNALIHKEKIIENNYRTVKSTDIMGYLER